MKFNRETGAGDGTLTLRLGSQTEAVTLAAQTGWNDLVLGTGTATKGWYENFREDYSGNGVRVELELASRTTGYLLIDEFIIAQPTKYDGLFYLLVAGNTNYLQDDYFEYIDTVSNTGKTQMWIARLWGKYFPHTTGAPTYADA